MQLHPDLAFLIGSRPPLGRFVESPSRCASDRVRRRLGEALASEVPECGEGIRAQPRRGLRLLGFERLLSQQRQLLERVLCRDLAIAERLRKSLRLLAD